MSKKEFIKNNAGKMRVKDMADQLKCSPAYVCKILKPKEKPVKLPGYFDVDNFFKHYYL